MRAAGAILLSLGILLWVGVAAVALASVRRPDQLLYLGIPLGGVTVFGGIILLAGIR
jgi:hypothetical protein